MRVARILLTIITCVLLCALPTAAYAAPKYRSATVVLDRLHKVTISSTKGAVVLLGTSSGPRRLGMSERGYRFAVGSKKKQRAQVYLTVRSLPTTSQVVFARLESPKQTVPVTVTFVGSGDSYSKTALGLKPHLDYNIHSGVDRSSGPYGWVTLSSAGTLDRSVFLSKAYRFKRLTRKYRGGTSTIKSLVSENSLVSVRKVSGHTIGISAGLSANKDSCERYFIVSPKAIVETDTPVSTLASVTAAEWRWLDPQGSYKKSGYSEPHSSYSFCRSFGSMRGTVTIGSYASNGSSLLENLLLSDVYSLALIRSSDGLWRTNYTSMWVKTESGIVAPYVDTRHNEAFAFQGPRIADVLDAHGVTTADAIRAWATPFATYLAGRAASGNVIRTAHGYFFSDYYDASGRAKTHSSLNHTLGEMDYLLLRSGDTSATVPFQVAMNIKAAIDDCGTAWIAPGHNMYYERDLTGTYKGYESPGLSYNELMVAQVYFQKFLGQTDPVFDLLLANKKLQLGITASNPGSSASAEATAADVLRTPDPADMPQ